MKKENIQKLSSNIIFIAVIVGANIAAQLFLYMSCYKYEIYRCAHMIPHGLPYDSEDCLLGGGLELYFSCMAISGLLIAINLVILLLTSNASYKIGIISSLLIIIIFGSVATHPIGDRFQAEVVASHFPIMQKQSRKVPAQIAPISNSQRRP